MLELDIDPGMAGINEKPKKLIDNTRLIMALSNGAELYFFKQPRCPGMGDLIK